MMLREDGLPAPRVGPGDESRTAVEHLAFDSVGQPSRDNFDAYHRLYRPGSDVSRIGGHFEARLKAWRLPHMILFDRSLAGLSHERSRGRVEADGFDHVTLQLVLDGRMLARVDESAARSVDPGALVTFDMTRPQRTWTLGSRYLTLSLGREVLREAKLTPSIFHGRVLPRPGPLGDVLHALLRHADAAAGDVATEAAGAIGDLVATAFGAVAPLPSRILRIAQFERAQRFIEANIARPDLSAELIGHALGMSRSVLYRLFEPCGGVAARIRRDRLAALHRALAAPGEDRSIDVIARNCGFATGSHANRLFSQSYGVSPGFFRLSIRHAAATDDGNGAAMRDLRPWIEDGF